nr:hypothetical protein [Kibdelosporangium sp. MJ126-NF4]CTQ94194.1 hypothetical protein [Kibdelosporangium sp. MJ126-NF4]
MQVLSDIREHKLGLLDDTDRVVVFEDNDRVRVALDEDTVLHLMSQGYVTRSQQGEVISCKWGVRTKPVTPLRLSTRGLALLHRWSVLKPL